MIIEICVGWSFFEGRDPNKFSNYVILGQLWGEEEPLNLPPLKNTVKESQIINHTIKKLSDSFIKYAAGNLKTKIWISRRR